jgi:hypothetical protein
MAVLREARAFVTTLWLIMQAALLIAPSVVLLTAAAHAEAEECSCIHGANAICPMHHRPAPGSKICLIGSIDSGLATLSSLFQAPGLMPRVSAAPIPTGVSSVSSLLAAAIPFRSAPPDPPPPRA